MNLNKLKKTYRSEKFLIAACVCSRGLKRTHDRPAEEPRINGFSVRNAFEESDFRKHKLGRAFSVEIEALVK